MSEEPDPVTLREIVERSRREQGLPPHITDGTALRLVARLVGRNAEAAREAAAAVNEEARRDHRHASP
jgi:hypothetical protein